MSAEASPSGLGRGRLQTGAAVMAIVDRIASIGALRLYAGLAAIALGASLFVAGLDRESISVVTAEGGAVEVASAGLFLAALAIGVVALLRRRPGGLIDWALPAAALVAFASEVSLLERVVGTFEVGGKRIHALHDLGTVVLKSLASEPLLPVAIAISAVAVAYPLRARRPARPGMARRSAVPLLLTALTLAGSAFLIDAATERMVAIGALDLAEDLLELFAAVLLVAAAGHSALQPSPLAHQGDPVRHREHGAVDALVGGDQ